VKLEVAKIVNLLDFLFVTGNVYKDPWKEQMCPRRMIRWRRPGNLG